MDTEEARIYYTIVIETGVIVFLASFFIGIMIWGHRKIKLSYKDRIFTESLIAENERARIAADLHDELGSSLAAIKLYLECIEPYNTMQRDGIAATAAYIDTAVNKIREISNNLTPKALQRSDFFTAARHFCETTARNARIQLRFHYGDGPQSIIKDKEIHLYRIIQEIITNAVRHAKPSHIDISLHIRTKQLYMAISDDGCGFDKEHAKTATGSGLHNIVNRVHLLKGTIYLDTEPGLGTEYTIQIPI